MLKAATQVIVARQEIKHQILFRMRLKGDMRNPTILGLLYRHSGFAVNEIFLGFVENLHRAGTRFLASAMG